MSDRKFRFRLSIIGVMALMFLSFLAWAAWLQIDQTVRAQGTVIASARTQIIQAADGVCSLRSWCKRARRSSPDSAWPCWKKTVAVPPFRRAGPRRPPCRLH